MLPSFGSLRPLRLRAGTLPICVESLGVAFRLDRVTRPDCGSVTASSVSRTSVLREDRRVLRLCEGGGGVVAGASDIELDRLPRLVRMILRGDDDVASATAGAGVALVMSLSGDLLPQTREGLRMSIARQHRLLSTRRPGMTMSLSRTGPFPSRSRFVCQLLFGLWPSLFTLLASATCSIATATPFLNFSTGAINLG
jgi:hypothetical protein